MTSTVAYLRRSSTKRKLIKIADQRAHISEWATRTGITIATWYADPGVSGSKRAERARPQYVAMLSAIDRGEINRLVVVEPSRLTRGYYDAGDLLDRMERRPELKVVSVPADGDAVEMGHRELHAWLVRAIEESQQIKDRVARHRRRATEAGQWTGGTAPYGYGRGAVNRDGKTVLGWVEDPEQAKIVRRIVEMIIQGVPPQRVAHILNAEEVPPPAAETWSGNTVRVLLRSGRFVGMHSAIATDDRGVKYPERRRELLPSTELYAFPALISLDQWHTVQDRLDEVTLARTQRLDPAAHLLSGYAVCDVCDARLKMHTRRRGDRTYRHIHHPGLSESRRRTSRCIGPCTMSTDDLERYIGRLVLDRLSFMPERVSEAPSQVDLEEVLADIDARRAELGRQLAAHPELGELLAPAAAELAAERQRATAALALADVDRDMARALQMADWTSGNMDRRRAVLSDHVATIKITPGRQSGGAFDPGRVQVVWKD